MSWVTPQGHPAHSSHSSRLDLLLFPTAGGLSSPSLPRAALPHVLHFLDAPKHQEKGFFSFGKTLKEFIEVFGRFHSSPPEGGKADPTLLMDMCLSPPLILLGMLGWTELWAEPLQLLLWGQNKDQPQKQSVSSVPCSGWQNRNYSCPRHKPQLSHCFPPTSPSQVPHSSLSTSSSNQFVQEVQKKSNWEGGRAEKEHEDTDVKIRC